MVENPLILEHVLRTQDNLCRQVSMSQESNQTLEPTRQNFLKHYMVKLAAITVSLSICFQQLYNAWNNIGRDLWKLSIPDAFSKQELDKVIHPCHAEFSVFKGDATHHMLLGCSINMHSLRGSASFREPFLRYVVLKGKMKSI